MLFIKCIYLSIGAPYLDIFRKFNTFCPRGLFIVSIPVAGVTSILVYYAVYEMREMLELYMQDNSK